MYRDLPENDADKAVYALQQFNEHIRTHFEQEELMLKKVVGLNEEIDELAAEIAAEHLELTKLFMELPEPKQLAEHLDYLANKLETHIRKEERQLFPMLQEHCNENLLQEIHQLLH